MGQKFKHCKNTENPTPREFAFGRTKIPPDKNWTIIRIFGIYVLRMLVARMTGSVRATQCKAYKRNCRNVWGNSLRSIHSIAKGAGGKGPRQKTSKIFKKCHKVFRHFSTIFAPGKKTSKIVKKRQQGFQHFSTIFARHHFTGPFWGALIYVGQDSKDGLLCHDDRMAKFTREAKG